MPTTAPYGTWKSPISSELATSSSIRYGGAYAEKTTDAVVWLENRPSESGRAVLVRKDKDGQRTDLNPLESKLNIRTRVHEYGGSSFVPGEVDGVYYVSNFADQRLYRISAFDGSIIPVTAGLEISRVRYADGMFDHKRHGILFVRELHSEDGKKVDNEVVFLSLDKNDVNKIATETVLASGSDFVSGPRLSPDGSTLAWVQWDHPNMPWDNTTLHVASIADDLTVTNKTCIAGENGGESIVSPAWGPHDGKLYYVSDRRGGWWNLFRFEGNGVHTCLLPLDKEFAEPAWMIGQGSFTFNQEDGKDVVYTKCSEDGFHKLMRIVLEGGKASSDVKTFDDLEFTSLTRASVKSDGKLVMCGGSPILPNTVFEFDPNTGATTVVATGSEKLDAKYLSVPSHLEFPTANGKSAYVYYYPPKNDDYIPSEGEKPPLLVKIHGGPTGSCSGSFNAQYQYWTSRGVAIADVNYGGSTGYGREYRDRLKGTWGIVDVEDCCNAATFLASTGKADIDRVTIDGGSAGGYTTLAAIAFRDVFKAGASLFGVADLELLAQETHKFESRYLDSLVGPYPAMKDTYIERSPIHSVDKISVPIILFQGLEDKVVPPNQATKMFDALKEKGIPTCIVLYEGEQHGFRMAKNQRRTLEGQFHFFGKVLGYTPADPLDEPLDIHNLEQ